MGGSQETLTSELRTIINTAVILMAMVYRKEAVYNFYFRSLTDEAHYGAQIKGKQVQTWL